jgi:hypothetical protein
VTTWLLESPSTGSRTTAGGAEGVGAIAMASSESLAVARVRRLLDPDRAPLGRGRAVGRAALLLLGVTAGAAPGVAAPAGSVPGAGVTHVLVRAHDPAGPFTLSIERDARGRTVRVLAMTVAGIPVPADRLRHRGDRVLLIAADGATTLEITLAPDGGIRWHPRSPAGSPTSLH